MLNYLKKFAMEIVPSVAATIIGAYIVNHYIVAKPGRRCPGGCRRVHVEVQGRDKPPKSSQGDARPKRGRQQCGQADERPTSPPSRHPASRPRAFPRRRMLEKNAAAEKAVVVEKPAEQGMKGRRQAGRNREHSRRTAPSPADAARKGGSQVMPCARAAVPPRRRRHRAAGRSRGAPEERRDANDLARAAIERLRGSDDTAPRPQGGRPCARRRRAPTDAPRAS